MKRCGLGKGDCGRRVLWMVVHDGFVIVMESLEEVMHLMVRSASFRCRREAATSGMCRLAWVWSTDHALRDLNMK